MQISAIQTDVRLGQPEFNLRTLRQFVEQESDRGSRLIVFPECFMSGYCFSSLEEAQLNAQPVSGTFSEAVIESCFKHDCYVIYGMLEAYGDRLFNTAVLAGPKGIVGTYRKVHLPWLGVDRFACHGDRPFEVLEVEGMRLGMLICYDGGFPEAVRCLALGGADVVILPTNWPPGAEQLAEHAGNTRALENSIYFVAANRVGTERGNQFIGWSRISDPSGRTMASADHTEACAIRATIDVERSRRKRIVRVPDEHIIDRLADRRPEMYATICESHSLPRPGRDEEL